MADFNYPEKYEIEEVCRNFVKRRFLNPHCSYPLCNSLISNIRIF